MDVFLNFITTNVFLIVWIIFWLSIFVFAFLDIKPDSISIILGFMLSYMLLFPISRRIVIFLTIDVANLRNITFACILLIFFICLLIYVVLKHFLNFSNENKIMQNSVEFLNQGYKAIFNFLIKFEFMETIFFLPVMGFLYKKVKTDKQRLYLYLAFNAIPKSIFFSSLFYDINILQYLHYSLYCCIFLLFPIIFNFYYKMLKLYSQANLDALATYIHVFYDDFDEEQIDALLIANLDPEKHACIKISLKRPPLEYVTEEWFAYDCMENFYRMHGWGYWCSCTKEFFNNIIYFRFTVVFLVIQILCQIATIINQL